MKNMAKKIGGKLQIVFGYGICFCLFFGGIMFLGYLVALCIGGDTAAAICTVIYKKIFPVIIKTSNILVLLGLLIMYLKGEVSLVMTKKEKKA